MARKYSSTAVQTSLTSGVNSSATTFVVDSVSGYPSTFPYTIIVDPDTASEEICEVTAATGVSLTVTRGIEGTTGIQHAVGAVVAHGFSARDFEEPQAHIDATTNVHGVGAGVAVVGTTTTQTLTNKTLTTPTIGSFTNAEHDHSNAAGGGNIPIASVTELSDALVAADAAITTVAGNLTTHEGDTSTHGVATVAGVTEAQTLTNKTLTAPTINTPEINDGSLEGDTVVPTGSTLQAVDMSPAYGTDATSFFVFATDWTESSEVVSASRVAPPSGKLRVDAWFRGYNDTAGESAYLSYEVTEGTINGSEEQAASNPRAASVSGTNPSSGAIADIVEGLTPGTTYFVKLMHKASANNAYYQTRSLIVTPTL